MKKILILILLFTMLLTISVYADSIPTNVLNEYNRIQSNYRHVVLYKTIAEGYYYINYTSDNDYFYHDSSLPVLQSYNKNTGSLSNFISLMYLPNGTYNETNIRTSINSDSRYVVFIKTNYDVYYRNSSDVFFSPIRVLTQEMEKIPGVAIQEMAVLIGPIGILTVGSMGLWKGYKFLKTQLSGA
ncbi:hypothetical protein [Sedimentibacter sp.]|uniref:hypothetical protein n=1 Tax=Sedimentibacter sp. TaxID=1960295 RepID=UPI00289796C6|nr:hypothetical protein [Sedimentibacter sp.]